MDTIGWLAAAWVLLYFCVRFVGRSLFGVGSGPEPTVSDPDDGRRSVRLARRRIGSAHAAVATMSADALAALISRRSQSRLRIRTSSRSNGTSLRLAAYARRGGLPRRSHGAVS